MKPCDTAGRLSLRRAQRRHSHLRCNRLLLCAELVIIVPVRFEILLPFATATIPLLLDGLSLWLRQSGWPAIGQARPAVAPGEAQAVFMGTAGQSVWRSHSAAMPAQYASLPCVVRGVYNR
jgi:hypothetical protein